MFLRVTSTKALVLLEKIMSSEMEQLRYMNVMTVQRVCVVSITVIGRINKLA